MGAIVMSVISMDLLQNAVANNDENKRLLKDFVNAKRISTYPLRIGKTTWRWNAWVPRSSTYYPLLAGKDIHRMLGIVALADVLNSYGG